METLEKVVYMQPVMKRVIRPTEVPLAVQDVAAFVRALYEPEILAMIEAVQEETADE